MTKVVGFSARLALAGRLGDEQAVNSSSWSAVEALLSEAIVDRSDELRSKALHRKALGIAKTLEELVAERREAVSLTGRDDVDALPAQASRLLALDRTACERVVQRMEDGRAQVADDLRPLRVAGMHADDVHASAYAEARVLARMTGPLTSSLVQVAGVDVSLEPLIRQAVAPVLRGATAEAVDIDRLSAIPTWRVVRACAMAAHDRVMERFDDEGRKPTVNPTWLRLTAARKALELPTSLFPVPSSPVSCGRGPLAAP